MKQASLNPPSSIRSWRRRSRILPVLAISVIFGGLGVYFLRGSHALVVNDAGASITLAPESADLKEGDIINVAINVDTSDTLSTSAKAVITYPSDSLRLLSVQQSCPKPDFDTASEDMAQSGTVTVTCTSAKGFTGQKAIAYLVFKGLETTGDAPLTVSQESELNGANDGKAMPRSVKQSRMTMLPANYSDKRPRAVQQVGSKPADCATPEPGHMRCHAVQATELDGRPLVDSRAVSKGLAPKDFHMAYQLPCTPGGPVAAVCATPSTYSRTIAIVDAGSYKGGVAAMEKDMTAFNQRFGLPPCTQANGCLKVVGQTGGPPPGNDIGWTDEMAMDIQAAHAICQTCKIVLVNSNTASPADMAAAVRYAASLKPMSVSMSFGSSNPVNDEASYNHPGMMMVASTGDDGVIPNIDNTPADYGSVLAAAGTTLQVNEDGTRANEIVWSGSGGGCSAHNTPPAWQLARPDWNGGGCGNKRAFGDMSADADPATGLIVSQEGQWFISGGTSLSAPLLASIAALAGPIDANTIGASVPYSRNNGQNTYDIHEGNDCTATYKVHCTSQFGFDTPAGLGSPNGTTSLGPTGVAAPDTTKPSVSFGADAPAEGATISSKISMSFNASDNTRIDHLTSQIDAYSLIQHPSSPYILNWATTAVPDGSHKVTVTAYDSSGNTATATRTFMVHNSTADTTKPTVSITNPAEGATISGSAYQATVTATDDVQVSAVIMQVDSGVLTNDTTAPYSLLIDTSKLSAGTHTMKATATDTSGNSAEASRTFTVAAAPTPTPPTPTPPTPTPPTPTPTPTTIPGDINGDKKVNLTDLSRLLSAWGTNNSAADLNKNGKVDLPDLSALLSHWTG